MNPEVTAQLLALSSLRKQAEGDAFAYWVASATTTPPLSVCREDWDEDPIKDRRINLMAWLLADFTRWQSQAWALRRIGELLGWHVGDRVPTLEFDRFTLSGAYILISASNQAMFSPTGWHAGQFHRAVSGIYGDTPRPEVIAAILLRLEAQ